MGDTNFSREKKCLAFIVLTKFSFVIITMSQSQLPNITNWLLYKIPLSPKRRHFFVGTYSLHAYDEAKLLKNQ